MKKVLFFFFAAFVVSAAVAFTSPKEDFESITFRFTGSVWEEGFAGSCPGDAVRCQLTYDATLYDQYRALIFAQISDSSPEGSFNVSIDHDNNSSTANISVPVTLLKKTAP